MILPALMSICCLLFGHHTSSLTTAFSTTRRSLITSTSFIATKSKYHPQVVSLLNRSSSTTIRLMSSLSSLTSSTLPTKWSDVVLNKSPSNINNIKTYTTNLFPPLTSKSHKGSHGRIAIIGGSDKYTGAPYYAAQSALNFGVDLVTVFCAKEASVPIKCYSPELMVQSVYSIEALNTLQKEENVLLKQLEECKQSNDIIMDTTTADDDNDTANNGNSQEMEQMLNKLEHSNEKQHLLIASELQSENDKMDELADRLSKMKRLGQQLQEVKDRQDAYINESVESIIEMLPSLHALCIGPGLGRHSLVFKVVSQVIHKAMELELALVLDADSLYMLSLEEYSKLLVELRGYEKCVMTPNVMEMRRLNDALSSSNASSINSNVCPAENHNIIVQKGSVDTISNIHSTMYCEEEGGLKRSGGIGDVLAGTISAFMAWNTMLETDSDDIDGIRQQQRVFACWTACVAVKKATKSAYDKKRRSMSALDISGEIGNVLDDIEHGLD